MAYISLSGSEDEVIFNCVYNTSAVVGMFLAQCLQIYQMSVVPD